MPNWSYNTLTIDGPREDIERFLAAIETTRNTEHFGGGYSLLRTFVPRPESVYDDGTWYDWSVTHWGTKWEDEMRMADSDGTTVRMSGETAWAPPIDGYATVSALFPTLTFVIDYVEEGGWFIGATRFVNGKTLTVDVHAEQPDFPNPDESIDDDDERWADLHERREALRDACRDAVTL